MLFFRNKKIAPALTKTDGKSLIGSLVIPEPTRSLIYFTDANPANAKNVFSLSVEIIISDHEETKEEANIKNLFSEPSMIWTRLKVEENDELEVKPLYYPCYSRLSPRQRYQYLSWLKDVTKPTNLSYVFLYYYGLERQLLVGDFESAVDEIARLLSSHDEGSFRSYAENALYAAILQKNRLDILDRHPFLLCSVTNEALYIRKELANGLTAEDFIEIVPAVKFSKRTYLQRYPDEFKKILQDEISAYELTNGLILDKISKDDLKWEERSVFANHSIPDHAREARVPQILQNKKFLEIVHLLLQNAHDKVKRNHHKKKITV